MEAQQNPPPESIPVVMGGIQILLAEKRTALAVLRTGIAVLALPLGVLSLLVATSDYYEPIRVLHLFVPLLVMCAGLVILAVFLIVRSVRRVRRVDVAIESFKASTPGLAPFLK